MSEHNEKQTDAILGKLGQTPNAPAAQPEKKKPATFDEWIKEMEGPLKEALPAIMPVERFSRMMITNYKMDAKLRECTLQSVLGSALQAAQLGLMVGNLDQAYLIPYRNYKGKDPRTKESIFESEAQLQIGYKGYIELGYRTNKISHITVEKVYATDEFDFEYGTNEFIKHKPRGLEEDDDKPTHFYCIVHLNNGEKKFLVRTFQQIYRHAKKHTDMLKMENGNLIPNVKSNWVKNFDPMALKTVIRELYKTIQLTTEVNIALAADGTIKHATADKISKNMAEEAIDVTRESDDPFPPNDEPAVPVEVEVVSPGGNAPDEQKGASAGQAPNQAPNTRHGGAGRGQQGGYEPQ